MPIAIHCPRAELRQYAKTHGLVPSRTAVLLIGAEPWEVMGLPETLRDFARVEAIFFSGADAREIVRLQSLTPAPSPTWFTKERARELAVFLREVRLADLNLVAACQYGERRTAGVTDVARDYFDFDLKRSDGYPLDAIHRYVRALLREGEEALFEDEDGEKFGCGKMLDPSRRVTNFWG